MIQPVVRFLRSKLTAFAAPLVLFGVVDSQAHAQTVPPDAVSASLQLARETVFEHECFDVILSIEIRDAQVGRNMELAGMPEAKILQFGQFKERPIQRSVRAGRQVEVRSYKCAVRALATGSVPMALSLRLGIVRTQNSALGTMRFETATVVTVPPRTITVVALPPPPAQTVFSGAVGQFLFSAAATPTNLGPGELVRIVSRVVGNGWTDGILPPRLSPGGAFRVYEPKAFPVSPGETPELQFEQTLVPQTTNATDIPALGFTYFDPASRSYHTATAGPFRLHFLARAPVAVENQSTPTVIMTGSSERRAPRSMLTGMRPSAKWTVLAVAIAYWIAVAVAMAALAARLRRGLLGALSLLVVAFLFFAGGVAAARQHFLVRPMGVVNRQEDARVAPGTDAFITFTVPKEASVVRIEQLEDWVKVDLAGNRGWVPASALSEKR